MEERNLIDFRKEDCMSTTQNFPKKEVPGQGFLDSYPKD
jgi:hypothetical protein